MKKQLGTIILSIFLLSMNSNAESISPDNPNIHYSGRIDRQDPTVYKHSWPGIYIKAKFTGTSISAKFGLPSAYDIFIDDVLQDKVTIEGWTNETYPLATGLSEGEHTILISKRNEQSWVTAEFRGFEIDDGASMLDPGPQPQHRIEYYGDSHMVGYGNEFNELTSEDPTTLPANTNTYLAYPALSARQLGVDYQVMARSGIGVFSDNSGNATNTLPSIYDFTQISTKTDKWDFSSWVPDIVVIGLGINDFSGGAAVGDYEEALTNFINDIRESYENDPYFVIVTSRHWKEPEFQAGGIRVMNEQISRGHKVFNFHYEPANYGFSQWTALSYHPSVEQHDSIGTALADFISDIIEVEGWPGEETNLSSFSAQSQDLHSDFAGIHSVSSNSMSLNVNEPGNYSIKLFSLNGREITSIQQSFYSAGGHQINWSANGISEGLYMVVISGVEGSVSFRTMVQD